jgi:peroxiredoxin
MKLLAGVCTTALILGMATTVPAQKPEIQHTNLKIGDKAPDFTLKGTDWKDVKLSDYRGKKNVVLAFYVLAFTGG